MPKDWEPPVPAFSAKIEAQSKAVVLYIGIQQPSSSSIADLNAVLHKQSIPHFDLASFIDRAGHKNYVVIAYFKSSTEHVQWEDSSGFSTWWSDEKHLQADYGLWMERYFFEPGQFETLFSTPDSLEGVGLQFNETVGPIREHAYWGGAEDRIPNSGVGKLQAGLNAMPSAEYAETLGKKITVHGPKNLCLIRSGQDLTAVKGEELETYSKYIEPALAKGLSFLAENSETGCFESRYMTHCDANGKSITKTFGMQMFLSIKHLQDWAKSHQTHLNIFGAFQKMAIERQGQFDLRLWHEVAVMGEGDTYAEYINCDPKTGFLPFKESL